MGLQPKIQQNNSFHSKICTFCGTDQPQSNYLRSKSIFSDHGCSTICNDCLRATLEKENFSWPSIDKLCQYLDIPFIPKEFEKLHEANQDNTFIIYSQVFFESEYQNLNWKEYYDQFKELKDGGFIEDELPLIREEKFRKLRDKWGANYEEEDLLYLEGLYSGLLTSQNVNGALQVDQAKKLCKISLEIDSRIRAGADFDKILASYDKLVKVAEFTPKNAKNASDFDSMGEVVLWLEKRGWINKFYDDVTRDVVDESLKNIQASNQRLYTNESGIGDDITERLQSLKRAQELENYYETDQDYDLESYQDEAWKEIYDKDEEFKPNGES